MVNVVDLGLVYGVHVDDDNNATIDMTADVAHLSPHRPHRVRHPDRAGGPRELRHDQLGLAAAVGLAMITDDGREQLRAIGFNV